MTMLHGITVLLYLIVDNNYECEAVKQEINITKLFATREYITMSMYEVYIRHEILDRLID